MLLDSIANGIIAESAEKILKGSLNEIEDPELLPQSLRDVIGKTYKFGVIIEKNNVAYGFKSYRVAKVWSISNMLMVDSQPETKSALDTTLPVDEISLLTDGEWKVTNAFDSSLVLINPDIKEAKAVNKSEFHGDANILEMSQHINEKIVIHEKRQKWSQYPFRTIQEMKYCDKGGNYRVICSVYAVDTINGWCKLDLLVQDQTGESKFTLLDSVAASIVKISAPKVMKGLLEKVEIQAMLPPEIVGIVGKSYGFGISFDENNNSSGLEKIEAMKVWGLKDILWKRTKSLHQNSTTSRKKQCTNVFKINESG
ncbi:hypothetical protein Bca101_005027 [Brassica carinata]